MSPGDDHGELIEQLRHSVLELLKEVPHAPRSVRVQAGEVSLDVEWGDGQVPATPLEAGAARDAGPSAPANDPDVDGDEPGRHYVTAPAVGTLYRAPEPGAAPFVEVGDEVAAGQQVAIVEVMKLMIAVRAETAGTVLAVLRTDGDQVEFGERLLALACVPT